VSYEYSLLEAKFLLPREQQNAALALIKQRCGLEANERIVGVETLADIFDHLPDCWQWQVDLALNGDIIGLELRYGTLTRLYSTTELFELLAPFVTQGSSIRIEGEERDQWLWEFDGRTMRRSEYDPDTGATRVHEPALDRGGILDFSAEMMDTWLRVAAVEILGTLGEEAPLSLLLSLLENGDHECTEAALRALKPLSNRVPLALIEQALNRGVYGIWKSAIELLEQREDDAWRRCARSNVCQDLYQRRSCSAPESCCMIQNRQRSAWQHERRWMLYRRMNPIETHRLQVMHGTRPAPSVQQIKMDMFLLNFMQPKVA